MELETTVRSKHQGAKRNVDQDDTEVGTERQRGWGRKLRGKRQDTKSRKMKAEKERNTRRRGARGRLQDQRRTKTHTQAEGAWALSWEI